MSDGTKSLIDARPRWHDFARPVLVLALSPIWLGCFVLGVFVGFAWDFFTIGLGEGPKLADWIDSD